MLRKRFRVMIDVDVSLLDLTVERIRDTRVQAARARETEALSVSFDALPYSVPTEEELLPQRQLLDVLLASSEQLDFFLKRAVIWDLDWGIVDDKTLGVDDDDLLHTLIDQLPAASREHFRDAKARDEFIDSTQDFFEAFQTEIVSLKVAEIPPNEDSPGTTITPRRCR